MNNYSFFILIQVVLCVTSSFAPIADLPSLPDLPPLPDVAIPSVTQSSSKPLPPPISNQGALGTTGPAKKNVLDSGATDGKESRGSWFKKRHWLLKARELQEKINALLVDIQAVSAPQYDSKRASFDKEADDFYAKIGFGKGQIEALFDDLAPYFEMGSKAKATLASQKLEASLSSSKNYQKYYDTALLQSQLKSDLSAIADIESAIDSRIEQFQKIIQQAGSKAGEAQKIINDIFSMVNHEEARDLYYRLEGIHSYLEAVLKFVKTDLASDIDKVIGLGKNRMDEVSKVVLSIKTVCDELKKGLEDQDKKMEEQPAEKSDEKAEQSRAQDRAEGTEKKESEKSLVAMFFDFLASFFSFFIRLF
ncbi:hypothetical protein FJ366_00250 [Candidatus Dependentiae bacterium]|nr:hypothetical protein [Candidatus Dependentiae bacterium]